MYCNRILKIFVMYCSYKVRKTIENLEWENYNRI